MSKQELDNLSNQYELSINQNYNLLSESVTLKEGIQRESSKCNSLNAKYNDSSKILKAQVTQLNQLQANNTQLSNNINFENNLIDKISYILRSYNEYTSSPEHQVITEQVNLNIEEARSMGDIIDQLNN